MSHKLSPNVRTDELHRLFYKLSRSSFTAMEIAEANRTCRRVTAEKVC